MLQGAKRTGRIHTARRPDGVVACRWTDNGISSSTSCSPARPGSAENRQVQVVRVMQPQLQAEDHAGGSTLIRPPISWSSVDTMTRLTVSACSPLRCCKLSGSSLQMGEYFARNALRTPPRAGIKTGTSGIVHWSNASMSLKQVFAGALSGAAS